MAKAKTKKETEEKTKPLIEFEDENDSSFIKPIISIAGHTNDLVQLYESGDMPEMTAIGYHRISALKNEFISYVVKFRGKEVLSIEVSEPNLYQIAVDESKINFMEKLKVEDL